MTDIKLTDLPDTAKELVDVIGLEATFRLISVYGGLALTFSDVGRAEVGTRRDIITKLIGPKLAKMFFRHFSNRVIVMPRCATALKRIRNAQICADADAGMSVPQLVAKYELHGRHIWRILKQSADKAA